MAVQRGILALEDGTVFEGVAFGAQTTVVGEACFNTSMTGYQEILTDPSYYAQIVTMTAPMIGNYGINADDAESDAPKVAGFVIRELSPVTSNWRSSEDLHSYLERHDIPGLERIDTRALTKRLRLHGALKACLSTDPEVSADEAIDRAKSWGGLSGVDNVQHVTCKASYNFKPGAHERGPFTVEGTYLHKAPERPTRYKVAAFDFGAKRSIFSKLTYHGFDVTVFPAQTPAADIRAFEPDAVFLSNGPGDPAPLGYAHTSARELMQAFPTFGICLGHQILTHALGAETFKLKFGHRGGNQPVKNLESGRVSITSQNHGFASTADELRNKGAVVTELNLNDQTVEGLRLADLPVFSVQYHPEAAPGPNDADPLFEAFYEMVHAARR
ncbi:MAG: glutamine-hydrolyzing carbamoyl-phosphate synthase small subunit [Opitutales bacterium]